MPRAESDPDPSGHDAVSEMHLAVPHTSPVFSLHAFFGK